MLNVSGNSSLQRSVYPVAQQVRLGHRQGVRMVLEPLVQRRSVVDVVRHAAVVELVANGITHQQVTTPELRLKPLQFLNQRLVPHEEGGLGLDSAIDQALLDQQVTRHHRVDRPVVHAPSGNDHEPKERDPFERHGRRLLTIPLDTVVRSASPDARPTVRSSGDRSGRTCGDSAASSRPTRRPRAISASS